MRLWSEADVKSRFDIVYTLCINEFRLVLSILRYVRSERRDKQERGQE